MKLRHLYILLTSLLVSCAIKDDIPYPIVEAAVTAFEVQGQCDASDAGFAAAQINKADAVIDIFVSDTVSLNAVRILKMEVSNNAEIIPGSSVCIHPELFPQKGFERPASTDNTWIDLSRGSASFTLRTYQDYEWRVRVHQVFLRDIQMSGQVGDAVIDSVNHNVIIYVNANQDLSAVAVQKFCPGGQHSTISPDPTATPTFDFSQMRTFYVTPGNSRFSEVWQVFVYHTEAQQGVTASHFARCTTTTISGQCPVGSTPVVTYRRQGDSDWQTVAQGQVSVDGSKYSAEISGLMAGGTYEYQVRAGETETGVQTFVTVAPQQLENSSFDEWHIEGEGTRALYLPWAENGQCYWDTGNHGATTVGASNSTFVDEGGRRFANLSSKYIVIKFAAGNIFTGEYIETDGTNGVLSFGRPFTSFPSKLSFDFKYRTSTITRTGGEWKEAYSDYISRQLYESLKGQPDSCCVYIALGDWVPETYKGVSCPYLIRTRPSALHLFNMNDSHLIAFGQMTCGRDVSSWKTETITLNYRVRDRQPKYIIVVASSSKYGDYFTGGEESLLQIDNLQLLYE